MVVGYLYTPTLKLLSAALYGRPELHKVLRLCRISHFFLCVRSKLIVSFLFHTNGPLWLLLPVISLFTQRLLLKTYGPFSFDFDFHGSLADGGSQVCDDGDPEHRHPISNVIDGTNSRWQSPTLQNGRRFEWVTITLDLKQVRYFNVCEPAHSRDKDDGAQTQRITTRVGKQLSFEERKRERNCEIVKDRDRTVCQPIRFFSASVINFVYHSLLEQRKTPSLYQFGSLSFNLENPLWVF